MWRLVGRSSRWFSAKSKSFRTQRAQYVRQLSTTPTTGQSEFGLSLQYQGDLAIIKMDNGQNMISSGFLTEFMGLLDAVESANCRALVTTGEGKYYSTGLDLQWLTQHDQEFITDFLHLLNTFFHRILFFPMPTLAVMNGHAYAGGAIMSFTHDLRTMNSEKGWLRLTEVLINIPFSDFMLSCVKMKSGGGIGVSDAAILGRKYTAEEATQHRLVHAAYSPDSQMDQSIELLNEIVPTSLPPFAVRTIKEQVYKEAADIFKEISNPSSDYSNNAYKVITDAVKKK